MADHGVDHGVAIGTMHYIKWNVTGKSWTIPEDFLVDASDCEEHIGSSKWLRMRPTNYGLCKLLDCPGASPTLTGSTGYTQLLGLRATAMNPPSDLWDQENEEKPTKKRKKQKKEVPAWLELSNGTIVKYPKKGSDDIMIPFSHQQISLFLNYMAQHGIEKTDASSSKRSYLKTGRYIKKASPTETSEDDGEVNNDG